MQKQTRIAVKELLIVVYRIIIIFQIYATISNYQTIAMFIPDISQKKIILIHTSTEGFLMINISTTKKSFSCLSTEGTFLM